MRSNVVDVVARSGRAEDKKERGNVTKADKGSNDHLDGRREQHVEFGIVNSATKRAKRNDNVKDHGSRSV
jgi:hypothetical protein